MIQLHHSCFLSNLPHTVDVSASVLVSAVVSSLDSHDVLFYKITVMC